MVGLHTILMGTKYAGFGAGLYTFILIAIIFYLVYEVIKDKTPIPNVESCIERCECGTAINFWDAPNCENCGRILPEYKWIDEDNKLKEEK